MRQSKLLICILIIFLSLQSYAEEVYPSCSDGWRFNLCAGIDGNIYLATKLNPHSRLFDRIALYRISPESLTAERLFLARNSDSYIHLSADTVYFFEKDAKWNGKWKLIGDHIWYSMSLDSASQDRENWTFLQNNDGDHGYMRYVTTLTDTFAIVQESASDDVKDSSIFRYEYGKYTYLFDAWGGSDYQTFVRFRYKDDNGDSPFHIYDGRKNRFFDIDRSVTYSPAGILLGDKMYMHDRDGLLVYDVNTKETTHLLAYDNEYSGQLCYDQSLLYVVDRDGEKTNLFVYSTVEEQFIDELHFETALAPCAYSLIVNKVLYNADNPAEKVYVLNLETMQSTVIDLDTKTW